MKALDPGRRPLNHYGSLESAVRRMREARPLDLNAARWRLEHPGGTHAEWRAVARGCLRQGLHAVPSDLDLQPEVLARCETEDFVRERIAFNTAPWFRVPGYFYFPKKAPLPAPGLIVMHEWGGPMVFGAERVCGEPVHPILAEHRESYTGGRALADFYAANGYCVLTIDAFHFGSRAPRGINGLPESYDPRTLRREELDELQAKLSDSLYLGVKQLAWAGTTWCGVNFGDDSRCIDYLLSRPEVDAARLGVTGLSGGGWRTNILAALDDRITAAVPVGWMTTGDAQQAYNIAGAVGSFCLLPGVWDRLDVPDLIAMGCPAACMVVSGTRDPLFPPAGQRSAARQIAEAYEWAGCPERFRDYAPEKPHCYDREIQDQALAWFDRHLKSGP